MLKVRVRSYCQRRYQKLKSKRAAAASEINNKVRFVNVNDSNPMVTTTPQVTQTCPHSAVTDIRIQHTVHIFDRDMFINTIQIHVVLSILNKQQLLTNQKNCSHERSLEHLNILFCMAYVYCSPTSVPCSRSIYDQLFSCGLILAPELFSCGLVLAPELFSCGLILAPELFSCGLVSAPDCVL